jgi:hypothetical protein
LPVSEPSATGLPEQKALRKTRAPTRLKILVNISDGGKQRPIDFADKGKRGHIFYVLERQK